MKKALLAIASALGWVWRLLPARLRDGAVMGLLILDSRNPDPKDGLRRLLRARDLLDRVTAERAMALGEGVHPKHRLMRYHDFFIDRIAPDAHVLDVGCGYGAVARSIAKAHPGATVVGVDWDKPRLAQARAADNTPNVSYVEGDATKEVPDGPWSVIVLSNVLEHIRERPEFLSRLRDVTGVERFLIRVPLFEREWTMPLRKELGVNYYSDPDHKIEPSIGEFHREIGQAGLTAVEVQTLWGEIWADCRVAAAPRAAAVDAQAAEPAPAGG